MSVHLRLGMLYLNQEIYAAAADAFRLALDELPANARGNAWWGLGTALARGGDNRASLAAFDDALAESPSNISLATEYVEALRTTEPDPARQHAILSAHPALACNPYLTYALSNILLLLGELPAAIAIRDAELGFGGALKNRVFQIERFRCTALHRLPPGDTAVGIVPWDITRRLGFAVHPDGYQPPFERIESAQAQLVTMPNGLFLGGETWVADAAQRIFVDLHFDVPRQNLPFYFHVGGVGEHLPVIVPEPCAIIDGPAIALGGSINYYHWIADFLPRLIAILAEPRLDGVPILISAPRTSFQTWWLDTLGVDPDRIVDVPYPGSVRSRELIVPIVPFCERMALLEPYRARKAGDKRLFVIRTDGHRRMHGMDEIASLLASRGFVAVDPGRLPPGEQIALFNQAGHVVGPHGAGLVNAAFSAEAVPLIEISHPAWAHPFFSNLSAATNRPYAAIAAEPCIEEARLPLFWDMSATRQTLNDLRTALDAVD